MTTHAATMNAQAHEAHEEEGMNRGMWGMMLFIGSEVMLFAGLFAMYFYIRTQNPTWPPDGIEALPDKYLALGLAVILLSSGLFGHLGIIAMREGRYGIGPLSVNTDRRQGLMLGVGIAITLGLIFIGLQAYEWFNLFDEGLTAKSGVYGSSFFLMTGFHGAHVIAGLAMLVLVFIRASWRDFTPSRHLFADASMMYWHFVDFVWIILVIVVYWMGT
ncbi:MAG TPA: cytochrome c oxidase subunit 3, partial [Dehalococcoidia bacterium]